MHETMLQLNSDAANTDDILYIVYIYIYKKITSEVITMRERERKGGVARRGFVILESDSG